MNTTLPPSRDLPWVRHAEIRAEVLAEVSAPPAHRRLAPLAAAVAALAVIGLVGWLAPWRAEVGTPGLSVADSADEITRACVEASGLDGEFVLRQQLSDAAGVLAVLDDGKYQLICSLDDGGPGYSARHRELRPYTPPVSMDSLMGFTSVDTGHPRSASAVGRISPEVARVTFVIGAKSVDAVLGDGTYLARIFEPGDYLSEDSPVTPVVRAYDKNGTLLAEVGP